MADDPRIPKLNYLSPSEPAQNDRRRAHTLSRTLDRAAGTVESRQEARRRYRDMGLNPPEIEDRYYEA
jgi:hypothetical protein